MSLGAFEPFVDEVTERKLKYDLVFASGVVYLYDDELLDAFVERCRLVLRSSGLLILRDFISDPPRVLPSAYIKDGHCHYRSPEFWRKKAAGTGLELLDIVRSKPRLDLLRRPKVIKTLNQVGIGSWLRSSFAVKTACRFGNWDASGPGIHTTYIVMRLP